MTRAFWRGAAEIIRSGAEKTEQERRAPGATALLYVVVFGCSYGALMGSFGGLAGDRSLVMLFSALKVPILLATTFIVCLPSFFILNTVLGVREDFGHVLRALLQTQAGLTILLLSLAPYTLLWYASFSDYNAAILFNALVFGVASLAAQWILRRHYRPLVARNARHRILLRFWLVLYAFVGIQTAWILRPFVGSPSLPAQFFRDEAWGNAYVEVAAKMRDLWRDQSGSGR